jgi:N6-adenosine-specific RNA methylase IME4
MNDSVVQTGVDYQVMPPLSADDYESLKADIAARGVMVPVEYDEHGNILDGHHRASIWTELTAAGAALAPFPRVIRVGFTEAEKRTHARKLNLARRHLNQEQRRTLIQQELKDNPEKSNRQIAEGLKVSDHTVKSVRDDLEGRAQIARISHVVDTIGRKQEIQKKITRTKRGRPRKDRFLSSSAIVNAEARAAREQARDQRRQANLAKVEQAAPLADVDARFATIVIDPPWDWGDEGDVNQMGRAKPDYATIPYEKLRALPVADKADTDCHLYLWITNRSLPKGFALLGSWGFRYITCLTWIKPSFGMGNYFRGQSEQVLFGVKGSQPLKRKDASTVFHAPRGPNGHSSKPTEFYDLVESWSPGPYLEIFSRTQRPQWAAWGESA